MFTVSLWTDRPPQEKQYDKCPKIMYTKVTDKLAYANSADLDQSAPKGAVWSGSTLFAISLIIISNKCIIKSKIEAKKYGIKCLKF